MRNDGFKTETDICGRGLKAQMKFANKTGAKFTMVLGDTEIEQNSAKLKNMATGEENEVKLDSLSDELYKALNNAALKDLEEAILNQ